MPDFQSIYQSKLISQRDLVSRYKPGDTIQVGVWYGHPYGALKALSEHGAGIDPLYVFQVFANFPWPYMNHPGVRVLTGFQGPFERDAQRRNNNVFYIPVQFTEVQRLVREGNPFDWVLHRVAPMDERGMLNFSMTESWEYRAIKWLKENRPQTKIVFEVNHRMPRVCGLAEYGANEHPIDYADFIVEDDSPLLEFPVAPPTAAEQGIADNVAALIDDKTTVQLGFGNIPMAIGKLLCERKDLGIHTEMFCDAHIDMIEAGSVTNAHKGIFDGVSVATFALGMPRLHNWLRDNKRFAMLPVEVTNAADIIARNNKMASINSVLTIDACGQTCAHTLKTKTYSGLGGAFEFAYGAQLAPGGKSIACLPSTTKLKDGTVVSNIVVRHEPGARITIPEYLTDWVVTEYGAVRVKLLSLDERAKALISIAHPDFRDPLSREAEAAGFRIAKVSELRPAPGAFFAKA